MKHPVDTSQWGEFLLNDIATLTNGNKFDKNKMSHDNPSINFVSRTGFNNGISDFVDKIDGTKPYPAGTITLALGGSVGSTFVQPKPFYTGQNVGVIEFENKSDEMKQFVAVILNKVCSTQFSAFKNEINKHFKRDLSIPRPLKPSADPSNYDSTDIDWNYMETVMSRVTTRAKERLANLPQPTEKCKTPVDTSGWGEFVVGELFDAVPCAKLTKKELIPGDALLVTNAKTQTRRVGNDARTFEDVIVVTCFGDAFYFASEIIPSCVIVLRQQHNKGKEFALFVTAILNATLKGYAFKNRATKKQDIINKNKTTS